MNEQNDQEKQESEVCAPGCSCGKTASGGGGRLIAGSIILLIAFGLVARAMLKNNGAPLAPTSTGFSALPAPEQTPEAAPAATQSKTDTLKEIAALSELNVVATNMAGVFIFLPGKTETAIGIPMEQIQSAARTIEPQLRGSGKIGMFILKTDSRDYGQIASQVTVPGVLAMVKGGGMSVVSGEITETKLVQAFVAASSSQGCGAGSCGPAGCN